MALAKLPKQFLCPNYVEKGK